MGAEEDFRKHLDFIQSIISRLAGNSFSIKTWAVGLIGVLGAFAAKDADARFSCALLFPALCLWWLDAYYLREEHLYRSLYQKVVANDANAPLFSLDPTPFKKDVGSLWSFAFSPTVRLLHLPILLFVIALIIYSFSGISKPGSAQSRGAAVKSAQAN